MRNNLFSCTVLRSARLARARPIRSLVLHRTTVYTATTRGTMYTCTSGVMASKKLYLSNRCVGFHIRVSPKDNIAFLPFLYKITLGSSYLRRRWIAQCTCATLPNLQECRVRPYRASLMAQVWFDRKL